MKLIILMVAIVLAAPVHAQQGAPGWSAYQMGDFDGARSKARAGAELSNSADAYALACRAGLVVGGFLESGKAAVDSLHQALRDCERALSLEPAHYVAGLSHAIALGFEGLRLRKASYARASKREIEALIRKYPDNALALGALAGWHAAVAREGWLARVFLGASRARAATLYSRAVRLPRTEFPLNYEYIRFLAGGKTDDRATAAAMIENAIEAGAKDGLDALLLDRSSNILKAIRTTSKQQLRDSLEAATPFGAIDEWGVPERTSVAPYPLRKARQTND